MWTFVVPLVLISVFHDTILPQALYGLVTQGAGLLIGPYFGVWMDRQPRMRGAMSVVAGIHSDPALSVVFQMIVIQLGIALQAFAVATSSVLLGIILAISQPDTTLFVDPGPTGLYIGLLCSAIAEQLGFVRNQMVSIASLTHGAVPW
jgi:hypothetical protein